MLHEANTNNTRKRYAEKLLDQRWQQRKTAIQIRDKFHCRKCGIQNATVHVHHRHYIAGREPWDYPDELLVLLCSKCHAEEERDATVIKDMALVLHHYGYFNSEIVAFINKLIESKMPKKDGVEIHGHGNME